MKNILKFTAMLLAVSCGMIRMDTAAAEQVSQCGKNITWHYDADTKTLVLEGTGEMYDYGERFNHAPWYDKYPYEQISFSEGITSIGTYAFAFGFDLKEVTLPESVRKIGDSAFHYCVDLKTVTLPAVKEIGADAFGTCLNLTSVSLADGLECIGAGCFTVCYKLDDLKIPETVQEIGEGCFRGCLTWYISQNTDYVILGDGILCKYLGSETDLVIPDSVKQINGDFLSVPPIDQLRESEKWVPEEKNTGITGVKLPEGLRGIGANAFAGCTGLENINIPDTVHSIGGNAFQDTAWLKTAGDTVILGDGVLYCLQGHQKYYEIPADVHAVSGSAIPVSTITEVLIPETVTELAPDAITAKNAVISGIRGGIAEQYAVEHGMTFRDINSVPDGADMTPDLKKDFWSFGNYAENFGDRFILSDAAKAKLRTLGANDTLLEKKWNGSCVGMSATAILSMNGFFTPAQLQKGAKSLSEIKLTDEVHSLINYYQCMQYVTSNQQEYEPFPQMFYRMIRSAEDVRYGASPFLIEYSTKTGAHGVVGYGLEKGTWKYDGRTYNRRILIWDSNAPDGLHDDNCLYYDRDTFDYTIPAYGIYVSDTDPDSDAGIFEVITDPGMLMKNPYPFAETGTPGDLNFDGSTTIADAVLLCKHLTTQEPLSRSQLMLADLSGDQQVTAADLTLLKRILLG